MRSLFKFRGRNPIRLALFALIAIGTFAFVPQFLRSSARNDGPKGLIQRTTSDEGIPNYDIRTDKSAIEKLAGFRTSVNRDAAAVADLRAAFAAGEASLKSRVPSLKVEYSEGLRNAEVIAPDVKQGRNFLTTTATNDRVGALRGFLKSNSLLVGVTPEQTDSLKVAADYTNPDGILSYVHLDQAIGGIPVFNGEVKAGFTKRGEIIRIINNLAPGVDVSSVAGDFGDPLAAVKSAATNINVSDDKLDLRRSESASSDRKVVFGTGDSATTAEKMYFPTEPGVAVAAWRVLIWRPVNAYYVIVDAATGTMLWRKNITEDQTQAATYSVYVNPNGMINVADNPFPLTPGPLSPNGAQGTAIGRTTVSRIGNEAPYTFNNNGWITDGGNVTDGNAVQAGLDRDGVDGVDTNSEAVGTSRNFSFTFAPFDPNTLTGDAPIPTTQTYPGSIYQQGSATQLFWITNWYHDETYRIGFTEAARNFQNDNFGRGGLGADRVRGEGQDSSGTNNANFSTPADGGRGRMQMYIWTGPNPDVDGNFDADVVIHEFTHGLSNRLHGNGGGLSTNMSRGMGEGWSDFYAHSLLSEPTDPVNGIYTTGGYDTYNISAGFTNNYYYGIRRYPKAVIGFTGGVNNKPHNAYTFSYVNSDCNAKLTNANFAFARGPVGVTTCDQVHNLGEVWSSTLWEVRGRYVTRLGWATGNRRWLQFVTDGMKLAPIGPTFLQERDAIIAAAQASGTAADVSDAWEGFRLRGMGFSAAVTNAGTGASDTVVTEAFDSPNIVQSPNITVSDTPGDNDGTAEPGESILINVPISNSTGNAATGTTVSIVGGGNVNYGTVAHGTTVTNGIPFTVPGATPCGSAITLTININSNLGAFSVTRTISIGAPVTTFTENFDGVTAPALPAGWTAVSVQSGINFVNSTLFADSAPNAVFAADPTTVGGGSDLTSPTIPITSSAAQLTFRHRYDTESGWDGGVVEISIAGGAFQDVIAAGGAFIANGYNGVLGANGVNSPLGGRNAWSGNSNGFVTSTIRLPAAAAGQNIQLKFRFGGDDNTAGTGPNPGWSVDSVSVAGSATCSLATTVRSRVDFDGDGKSDISVFRPSSGVWYQNRSTAGFTATNWGVSTDKIVPADYDGDGKADVAIFRPSTGEWYILRSSDGGFSAPGFGAAGDIPQTGDYDGDGKADLAVFRPSTNVWYVLKSGGGTSITAFGAAGDVPARGDFNGDGKTDIAVFRPSTGTWWIQLTGGAVTTTNFGVSTDVPVAADYDGDNKDDVAVFRPSTGVWYILRSSNGGFDAIAFGISTDTPVPGDYDGDGRDDVAIYRGGVWWVNRSTGGVTTSSFGLATDTPALAVLP